MKTPVVHAKTRIMLFTDEPQLALGATCLLSEALDFEIVRGPSSIADLLPSVSALQPQILLIDLSAEMTLAFFSVIRGAVPECRIVLWSRTVPEELAQQALDAGIAGILLRTADNDDFVRQLRRIGTGEAIFEDHSPDRSTKVRLSRRESQIVGLLSQGLKNKEIATCLGVTEGTVKGYLVHLFQKVGARDRFELAVLGLKNAYYGQAYWDGKNGFVTEAEDARSRPYLRSLVLVQPVRRTGYPEEAAHVAVGSA